MNDIEIIKKWIEDIRTGKRVNIIHKGDVDFCNNLENLIKENKELKEGLKYRVNYCKLLEKELYGTKENKFEKTEYEKRYLED